MPSESSLLSRVSAGALKIRRSSVGRLAGGFLRPGLGQAQPLGQLGDDLGRRARHHAGPALRQQIDEGLVAGLDEIGLVGLRQSEAHAAPVRVDARDRDVIRQLAGDARDIDADRAAEGDDQHAVGDADAGLGGFVEGERDAAEARRHRLAAQGGAGGERRRVQPGGMREGGQSDTEGEGTRQTQTGILDPTRQRAPPHQLDAATLGHASASTITPP